jgi:Tfp pilus assembly protein PilO
VKQRDKLLISVIAIVGVLAAGWFTLLAPKREDARQIDAQITAAQSQLAGASARAAQYRAARRSLLQHPEAFKRAGRALPTRAAMPDLLRTLTRTARGTGVKISELSTSAGGADAAITAAGIGSVGLSLSFNGDFLALQRYLARLQRFVAVSRKEVDANGRLVALNSVQMSRGDDALTAKVSATVYVLQPGGLTAAAAPAPTTTAPAPASTPTAGGS